MGRQTESLDLDDWAMWEDRECREAAEEIKRLRIMVEQATTALNSSSAEIERLRAALESLTVDPPATLSREPDTDAEVIIKMRAIARAALKDTTP